jgi:hypothetical protein
MQPAESWHDRPRRLCTLENAKGAALDTATELGCGLKCSSLQASGESGAEHSAGSQAASSAVCSSFFASLDRDGTAADE